MKRNVTLCLLAAFLCVPFALGQTEGANNARGFEPGKLYNFFGLDSISTFSGNLNVRIPICQTYMVRPGFEYQFYLTYNSKLWDFDNVTDSIRSAVPEKYSNAGFGWLLTLGKVLPPHNGRGWTYISSDGGHHEFLGSGAVRQTSDASYMRIKLAPADATKENVTSIKVETADGLLHTFDTSDFELNETIDPYGNWLRVTRTAPAWTVREGHGSGSEERVARTHTITFEQAPAGRYPADRINFQQRIKTIQLAAFAATTATFTLHYEDASLQNGGCGTPPQEGWDPPAEYNVPLLTKIDLPDGSSYVPQYNRTNDLALCSSGTMKELTLPTKGSIAWGNGSYSLPREECVIEPGFFGGVWWDYHSGITSRKLKGHDGAVLEEKTYGPELLDAGQGTITCGSQTYHDTFPLPPKVFRNRLTTKSGGTTNHYTDHYFSAYRTILYTAPDAFIDEYGLPFTRTSLHDDDLRLSTQTFRANASLLRSTYVLYETDGGSGEGTSFNPRPKTTRTVFADDDGDTGNNCKKGEDTVPCWVQQDNSNFDSFGHYRTHTSSSNFPGVGTGCASDARSTFTNYNPGVTTWPATSPWILNTYTDSSITERCVTRTTLTAFDPGKGVIKSVRTGSGTGALLSATCRDARGFITSERSFGGDGRTLPADPCTAAPAAGEYMLAYTNSFTDNVALTARTATWDGTSHKVLDETLDRNTGLASSTRDGAALQTDYLFDASSRITSLDPPGLVPTTYSYSNASVSGTTLTPASVEATTASSDTTGSISKQYQFDALGRLWREKTLMPDGTWSLRETLFDGRGNKASVSEMERIVGSESSFHPQNKTTFSGYDQFDRVGSILTPDGKSTTLTYRGARKTTRTSTIAHALDQGERSVNTVEQSDAHGRLISVSEDAGAVLAATTSYTYDVSGKLASVSMPSGGQTQTRSFAYDSRGLMTLETHPELNNGSIAYSDFDARGQATRKVTGGSTDFDLTMEYDAASRLTKVKKTSGGQTIKEFAYNASTGRLFAAARYNDLPILGTIAVTESWGYHPTSGLPIRRDRSVGAPLTRSFAHTQAYNDLGLVQAVGYPYIVAVPETQRWTQAFQYTNGLLAAVDGWASIQYQANGLLAQVAHTGNVTETWTEDPFKMPRPRKITVASGANELWTSGYYGFDGAGNIKQIGVTQYFYDGHQRLTGWGSTGANGAYSRSTRTYDGFGNYVFSMEKGCGPASQTPQKCYSSGVLSKQLQGTTNRYLGINYDAAGNVTADSGRSFTYDAVNMPTSVTVGNRIFLYVYSADDERIAAVERLPNATNKTTWTIRGFNNELLTIWNGDTWNEDNVFRGSSLLGYDSATTGRRHYSLDHLGSSRVITDNSGNLVGLQYFSPFGAGGSTNSGALQFTGHERDRASLGDGVVDLPDYAHARLLEPGLGRFLSVDPRLPNAKAMRSPQRWNRYAYVSNNPLKNVDPDGREQVTFGDKRTELLFNRLEARNPQVRATLGRYRGEGTPDLHIQRGNAGLDTDGKTKAKGVLNAKIEPSYDVDKIVKSGAKQDESALMPATGIFLSGSKLVSATLTLDSSLTQGSKQEQSVALHELGHAEGAAANPDRYLAQGANDVVMVNGKLLPHDDRPLEKEAEQYRTQIEPP